MAHVTGIGGVFFKSRNSGALSAWYAKHLGIDIQPWGGAVLRWREDKGADTAATAWKIEESRSDKFSPSQATFMINYRVEDLKGMIANLKKSGVSILKEPETSEFGTFASILDPDGNRVELWEP